MFAKDSLEQLTSQPRQTSRHSSRPPSVIRDASKAFQPLDLLFENVSLDSDKENIDAPVTILSTPNLTRPATEIHRQPLHVISPNIDHSINDNPEETVVGLRARLKAKGSEAGHKIRRSGSRSKRKLASWLSRHDKRSARPVSFNVEDSSPIPAVQPIPRSRRNSTVLDEGTALLRADRRRLILSELQETELGYLSDLNVLSGVYMSLLMTSPASDTNLLSQINANVKEIEQLHQDLSSGLEQIITRNKPRTSFASIRRSLSRRRQDPGDDSSKIGEILKHTLSLRRREPETHFNFNALLSSDPKEAEDVARLFMTLMPKFFIYEEYACRYQKMLNRFAQASRKIDDWDILERLIEDISNTTVTNILPPVGTAKKSMTFRDMLVKPIQRVCRYALLFQDLHRQLPMMDDPEASACVEKVLFRMREVVVEINHATNDETIRAQIERSWALQDFLTFSEPLNAPFSIRSLGKPILCGVLHVTYPTKDSAVGNYMLCCLFKQFLLFAKPSPDFKSYTVVANIALSELSFEASDSGSGLQCHTALFSWKIIFESGMKLYEILLSACSEQEEEQWRRQIHRESVNSGRPMHFEPGLSVEHMGFLDMGIAPIGSVSGLPGTLARRLSVHRAATVGPRSGVTQVFVRDTHVPTTQNPELLARSSSALAMTRSLSLKPSHRIPVIAPRRSERIRMEQALREVWTTDLLPYPGMSETFHERLSRNPAIASMRRISKTSMASSFTFRPPSFTSMTNSRLASPAQQTV